VLEEISKCKKCKLCKNQRPLLDKNNSCDIMWVGLSAKKVEDINKTIPLCNDTNSGKIIEKIENKLNDFRFYKTNLVKCLPLDKNNKLRYPTIEEMNSCIENLLLEINYFKPKIIFVLGKKHTISYINILLTIILIQVVFIILNIHLIYTFIKGNI
jgi:DNA polymerase